jgi:hypothetical protein
MSKIKWMVGSGFALALALLAWGCSGKAGVATPYSPVTGQHPADWLQVHYTEYIKNPNQCRTCHGSTTDPTQAGGISKVSCFSCHTSGLVIHPLSGWSASTQHGRLGAQLAPVDTGAGSVPVMAGFAHCQKCHGSDFSGGIANVSCFSCHQTTAAPHPPKPWLSTAAGTVSHSVTDQGNAAVCYGCHKNGANFTGTLVNPAPPNTAPGCFNATMCHAYPVPTT